MTDRELLEKAAKAAGLELHEWTGPDDPAFPNRYWSPTIDAYWGPLEDDGDALRLAVTLGIQVGDYHQYNKALAFTGWARGRGEFWEDGEPLAATRRTIVRAAAAIGDGNAQA